MEKRTLIDGFTTSHSTLMANLTDIDNATSVAQPEAGGNCINWIAGHLLNARGNMLAMLGGEPFLNDEENERYKRGSEPIRGGDAHTDIARIVDGLKKTHERTIATLEAMPEEKLASELDESVFPAPVKQQTLGTMLGLFLFHEGYHTGQLGLARYAAGKGAVIK